MSRLRRVPFMLYRSGTSRGPYFLAHDVPPAGPERDQFLARAMGSGHPQQIDGLGGGCGPTSKAVVVGVDSRDEVDAKDAQPAHSNSATRQSLGASVNGDVDTAQNSVSLTYDFSQCRVAEESVDHSHGDCGNMIAAVLPFAVEKNLIGRKVVGSTAETNLDGNTSDVGSALPIRIRSLVTGTVYEARILDNEHADGKKLDVPGAPSSGFPVELTTHGVAGAQTGMLLPTGKVVDEFFVNIEQDSSGPIESERFNSDIAVRATVVDFARVLVILDAREIFLRLCAGKASESLSTASQEGHAQLRHCPKAQLEGNARLNMLLEQVREQASFAAGMGSCKGKDAPKVILIAPPAEASTGAAAELDCRYYVNPGRSELHPTIAMTAAQALGAACLLDGSVAADILKTPEPCSRKEPKSTFSFGFRHEKGVFPVKIGVESSGDGCSLRPVTASYTTTVKPIADGHIFAE